MRQSSVPSPEALFTPQKASARNAQPRFLEKLPFQRILQRLANPHMAARQRVFAAAGLALHENSPMLDKHRRDAQLTDGIRRFEQPISVHSHPSSQNSARRLM